MVLGMATAAFAQHFTPVWSGGALNPMTITVTDATLNSVALQAGDEIAVFDGSYCVGSFQLTEPITPANSGTYVYVTCSKDDPDTPEVDGFTVGNAISYKYYDASDDVELDGIDVAFPYAPNYQFAVFTENETAIVALSKTSVVTYTVTTVSSPAEGGTTSGGGIFTSGTQTTLLAQPNAGFSFMNWTNNGVIVSSSASYSLVVTEDITLQANFIPISNQDVSLISYQAVVRDETSAIVTNTDVGFNLIIRKDSNEGSIVYSETHAVTTNDFGLVNLFIGNGSQTSATTYSAIDWSDGPYFLEIQLDIENSGTYTAMGTQQMVAVPFSNYSTTSSQAKSLQLQSPNGTVYQITVHDDGTIVATPL